MTEVLKLKTPVYINGKEIRELSYDFESMTASDLRLAGKAYKRDGNVMQVSELDSDYHLFVFAKSVEKTTNGSEDGIDMTDITSRLNARDAARASALVRDFFFTPSEE